MRRSIYFIAVCVVVIAPTVACGRLVSDRYLIYVCAGVILEILLLALVHRQLFRPLRVITAGMDLLREQDFASRLNPVGQPDADSVVNIFNEMMDCLKERNLQVQEQNQFLDLLIEASPMGVIILDDKDRITSANDAALRMLGSVNHHSLSELTSPLGKALQQLNRMETRTVRPGGKNVFRCSRRYFMDRGWPHPFILIEKLTDEVHNAEKQAFTRVIRIMAHEVNNSMAGILTTISTVSEILKENPATANLVPTLQACAKRSESMTNFIRNFAEAVKVPDAKLCLTDFMELIESSKIILESLCTMNGTTLTIDVENAGPVRMDIELMQQAVVNIVKNAAESAGEGGVVNVIADGSSLHIVDNGPGLDADAEEHLFSALYTTKPQGQGLGLMLVAEILQKHNADFSLCTEAPRRTVFTITLGLAREHR